MDLLVFQPNTRFHMTRLYFSQVESVLLPLCHSFATFRTPVKATRLVVTEAKRFGGQCTMYGYFHIMINAYNRYVINTL